MAIGIGQSMNFGYGYLVHSGGSGYDITSGGATTYIIEHTSTGYQIWDSTHTTHLYTDATIDKSDIDTATFNVGLSGGNKFMVSLNDEGPAGTHISNLNTGDNITFVCFLTGTLIATESGSTPVEKLTIGSQVLTASGALKPVKWIGKLTVGTLFTDPERSYPVCIEAGALDENVPSRDLYVSPDHAVLVDGVLVNALALVNGASIRQLTQMDGRSFTYWHIELDDHDLVLAENTPSETFVDTATRRSFDNWQEYENLYPEERVMAELALPRIIARRQLSSVTTRRLGARAQAKARIAA